MRLGLLVVPQHGGAGGGRGVVVRDRHGEGVAVAVGDPAHRQGEPGEAEQRRVLVQGHGLGRGVAQRPVAHRVDHGRRRGRLLGHRGEHLALPLDPAEVAARVGLAHPHVAERGGAVQVLAALRQVDVGVLVLDRLGQAHLDAAQRVDDVDEPAEADLDVGVDPQAGVGLDGLHQQLRPAERVRGVDLVAALAGDRHVRVARHRDQRRLPAHRDVDEHDRVGPPAGGAAGAQPLLLLLGQALAGVGADQQEGLAGLVGRDGRRRGRRPAGPPCSTRTPARRSARAGPARPARRPRGRRCGPGAARRGCGRPLRTRAGRRGGPGGPGGRPGAVGAAGAAPAPSGPSPGCARARAAGRSRPYNHSRSSSPASA